MQVRGKKIFCMNKIRLAILRQMWNDHKHILIQNLKKPGQKKKEKLRKKRLNKLLCLTEAVREKTLKLYFHICKEKAAKKFIEWRIEQAQVTQNRAIKKAIRLRRLTDFHRFEKEEAIFSLYRENEHNFDAVKSELMQMELELQRERKVPIWTSMYDLIIDSHASALYLQSFIDRQSSKEY